ncbi:MAG: hypothetical protein IPL26_06960 [Leptospiraceae bacterium]|nr:hypothetical protein [Leptospiraceae bacterium]
MYKEYNSSRGIFLFDPDNGKGVIGVPNGEIKFHMKNGQIVITQGFGPRDEMFVREYLYEAKIL